MNDTSDIQLLRDYAERRDESAFREIVCRHTDFVYSAALRQLESPDAAADVAQTVFVDLARKANSVARDAARNPSGNLAGWLHRATRFAALNHLREARRRYTNERQAMQQLLTDSESSAEWEQIRPVLDEALDNLGDEDREALLLRYFKNHNFRDVGFALGISDDAAQKRVSRAVERLREFFSKRNVTIGASGLVVLISANAVESAPTALISTISTAALSGVAVSSSTVIAATKTIAMTTLQKTLVTATVAVLAGAGIYEARQATQLHEQVQAFQQRQASLTEQIQHLQSERDNATNRLADLLAENLRLKSNPHEVELLKLRGEISRVQQDYNNLLKVNQALQANAAAGESTNEIPAYDRAILLKQHASDAAGLIMDAIRKYASENNGRRPAELRQLLLSGDLNTTNFAGNIALNDFDLTEAGSTNVHGKEILLRLRAPIRNPGEQSIMVEGGVDADGTPFTEIYNVAE